MSKCLCNKLLETLEDLSYGELNEFKLVLQRPETTSGHLRIPKRQMKMAQRVDLVELMVHTHGERSVEVTIEVLKTINRSDLVQRPHCAHTPGHFSKLAAS
uniref:Pyrin domain-containing protein n=1 Tax=Seriola dumerili TaxID=41447 RepID=A0A3B4UD28_SERDU